MKKVSIIQYPGLDNLEKNISEYVDIFLTGEVIAFRGANCSAGDQLKVAQIFGDQLNWWPNSKMDGIRGFSDPFYYETHHQSMDEHKTSNKDSLMLEWHLEHVGFQTEQYVGAIWSMNLFECDPDSGKTMFVDVEKIFSAMPAEDKEFLINCVVELVPMGEPLDVEVYIDKKNPNEVYNFVQNHWYLGTPVPRAVLNGSHLTKLVKIYGRAPEDGEISKFQSLFNHIVKEVRDNDENKSVHSWEQGDLLILDVFKLAHAITGGFDKNQRTLKGIFGINQI